MLFPLEFGLSCQFAYLNPQNVAIYGLKGRQSGGMNRCCNHALCDS
jgi:hypothetical protein